jgi:hypothetical protein
MYPAISAWFLLTFRRRSTPSHVLRLFNPAFSHFSILPTPRRRIKPDERAVEIGTRKDVTRDGGSAFYIQNGNDNNGRHNIGGRKMKKMLLILVTASMLFWLSGCVFVAGEDRHFHHDGGPHGPVFVGPHEPGHPGPHFR